MEKICDNISNTYEYYESKSDSIYLQEAEDKYRMLFENANDVIVYTDEYGKIIDINQRVELVFGCSPEKIIGKLYDDINIFRKEDTKKLSDYVSALLADTSTGVLELETVHNKGVQGFIEINTRILRVKGKVQGSISIIRDITKRKLQENIDRLNEEKFQFLFENANDGIIFLDKNGVIKSSNKKIEDLFGYNRDEVIGKMFTEFGILNPGDMINTFNIFKESVGGKLPPLLDYEGIHKGGKRFSIEINPTLIQENNEVTGLLAVIRDTTTRKVTEHERARLIDIIDATPDFVFTYDVNGNILYANQAGKEVIGLSAGNNISKIFPEEQQPSILSVENEGIWEGETKLIAKDKSAVQVSQVIMAHRKCESNELYFSTIMRDISDQKQNEKHIKNLSHQLIKIQENERLRISRELHDNLAQDLSSLKILFKTLFDSSYQIPEPLKEKITQMSNICQRSISSVRDLSYDLRPASLDELGLVKTIYQYCKEFNDNNNMHVVFNSAGMKQVDIDFDTAINFYRIIQEALNNIKKHADAKIIKVNLVSSYPTIILQIEDDGIGFDVKTRKKELVNEKRMGLKSIEERVSLLDGTFKIQSKHNIGTRIHVEVPA